MATAIGQGSASYARFAFEPTFGTAVGDSVLSGAFGHNVKFTASPSNSNERIPNLNSRNYAKHVAKKFEGSWSADFQASNFYHLQAVIGDAVTTGAGPFLHTFTERNTLSGMTIQQSEDLDTDSERTLVGCMVNNWTLSMNQGEVVTGRMDGSYRSESKDTSLNTTGNVADEEDVFSFSHATLDFPSATTLTEVQSLELSVTNNSEQIWGLGSRLATQKVWKQRVYDVTINKIREADSDLLDDFYGGTTSLTNPGTPANVATLKLVLNNGKADTEARSLTFELKNLQVADYNSPLEPVEAIKENGTLQALDLGTVSGVVYTNNSSTFPGQ